MIEKCEARHMGLTVEELHDYRKLKAEAEYAGAMTASVNNEMTRKRFDDKVEKLIKFEDEHNLKG